jgi:hypothetical protein
VFESKKLDEMIESGKTIDEITLVTNLEVYNGVEFLETKHGSLRVIAASIKDESEATMYFVTNLVPIGIKYEHDPIPEDGDIKYTGIFKIKWD